MRSLVACAVAATTVGINACCQRSRANRGRTSSGGLSNSTCRRFDSTPPSPIRSERISTTRRRFLSLDLKAVKQDIAKVLTTSQDWWPSDYGNYGPFFIRMAWHGAGTYRTGDGRGGASGAQQRFEPLNSWPDNANLDKARRLLWPIKQKYGEKISWGDLMVLTGNVALEQMGFQTFGFGGGRADDWEPDLVYWGPEKKFLEGDERYSGDRKLEKPLGASQMGLIYVNPEGPNGNPDPLAAAKDIRETFGRMAMNDEETVALIAGGHTFGKAHGAHDPSKCVGPAPAAAGIEQQGLGWQNTCGTGKGDDTVTSGLEGAWSASPTAFTMQYLNNLYAFDWVQTKSPGGAIQWTPANGQGANLVPDAQDPAKRHAPIMFTTDLALKFDPSYRKITTRWRQHPEEFKLAFAKAWFKLTHRDMGPRARYLGAEVPSVDLIWQDPLPKVDYKIIDSADIAELKSKILASGLDQRRARQNRLGIGCHVPRHRRARWRERGANSPRAAEGLGRQQPPGTRQSVAASGGHPEGLQPRAVRREEGFTRRPDRIGRRAPLSSRLRRRRATTCTCPSRQGAADASQEQTDPVSFAVLEPTADGFRNYFGNGVNRSPAEMLVDRASNLTLTVPEMTVLVGGMRVLNANAGQTQYGIFTDRPGTLTNDFFVNLLDMSYTWNKSAASDGIYEGHDRKTGALKWTATPVDLVFGSNSELRAVAEVYASSDGQEKFVTRLRQGVDQGDDPRPLWRDLRLT